MFSHDRAKLPSTEDEAKRIHVTIGAGLPKAQVPSMVVDGFRTYSVDLKNQIGKLKTKSAAVAPSQTPRGDDKPGCHRCGSQGHFIANGPEPDPRGGKGGKCKKKGKDGKGEPNPKAKAKAKA